ncbi:hypothetical protein [Propionibacterium acidifaciens]|uniref:hypothetical protein n=1 Tax=Propionibacterium acidifaciens TaxID=556499 RepID=UPI0012DF4AC7|nr:hypothetical protein [Propionibacterium acidifaciens]
MSTPQQPGSGGPGQNGPWMDQPPQPANGWQPGGAPPQGPGGQNPQGWQQPQPGGQPPQHDGQQPQSPYGQSAAFAAQGPQGPAQPGPGQPNAFPGQPAGPQGQPGPGQPNAFPGQPAGPQGQPGPGQPNAFPGQGTAFAAPGAAFPGGLQTGSATKPKSRKLAIIIGSIVLALIIGTVIAIVLAAGGSDQTKAKKTVTDYLTAVSEGNASKAKDYLSNSLDDTSLLTDDVLKDSLSRAPISNIVVSDAAQGPTNYEFDVPATYTIGDKDVSTTFEVDFFSKKPVIATSSYLSLSSFDGVTVTVNGTAPSSTSPYVFPGDYKVSTDHQYLTINGSDMQAYDPADGYVSGSDLELAVSDAGVQMFRQKVISEAQACLASTKIDPGCGAKLADLDDGSQIKEDSVHRTQDAENAAKLQSVTPEPGITTPTVIKADYYDLGKMDITASCGKDGNWSNCELYGFGSGSGMYFGSPSIDLNDPDLKVVWG